MSKLNVDGHPNLYRDLKSGAIINDNHTDYEQYMNMYRKKQQQSQRIDKIENEISEIKLLLQRLIEKHE